MALSIKLSYARRLYLWLLAYSFVLVGCLLVYQYQREKQFKAEELNAALQVVNAHILDNITTLDKIDLSNEYPIEGLRVSIIDLKGNVIFDNTLDTLPGTNHLSRKEIADAIVNVEAYSVRRLSDTTGSIYFYSAKKGEKYIVRTAVPYTVTLQELLKVDTGFLWIIAVIMAVMCTLGFFATKRLGQHIKRLREFAAKAERGEKIYNIEPFTHDELGDISNDIVRLYARLQQAITDRDHEHRLAMHQEQEKIRIKRQLTNNISHELKTPVASIRVCIETMLAHKDMDAHKREEFLTRCVSNCDRLQRLLADVALITRMDEGAGEVQRERLNLADIIKDVCDDMHQQAAEKGMLIEQGCIEGNLEMNGNRGLLSSVFYNLIDNAISYSGGSTVKISVLSTDKDRIMLMFEDDGAGVAEENLERLFERFYRVDKGRSRKAGGTGLGLSIVKNAVTLHKGSIRVENKSTGGLRFIIVLGR